MFDIFSFGNPGDHHQDWVNIATDSKTGFYNDYLNYLGSGTSDDQKIVAWGKAALDSPSQGIPATNYAYNGVSIVDDPTLAANAAAGNPANPGDTNPPSMPFNWDTAEGFGNTQDHLIDTINSFTAWINYVKSSGNDGLRR